MYYTIGQRQGLGIGGRQDASEEPWFVVGKDLDNNILSVVQGSEHPSLFMQGLFAIDAHWIDGQAPALPVNCMAKTRYRQPDQACTIEQHDDKTLRVVFENSQRAITPGQSIVFYDSDCCLGGAVITEGFN